MTVHFYHYTHPSNEIITMKLGLTSDFLEMESKKSSQILEKIGKVVSDALSHAGTSSPPGGSLWKEIVYIKPCEFHVESVQRLMKLLNDVVSPNEFRTQFQLKEVEHSLKDLISYLETYIPSQSKLDSLKNQVGKACEQLKVIRDTLSEPLDSNYDLRQSRITEAIESLSLSLSDAPMQQFKHKLQQATSLLNSLAPVDPLLGLECSELKCSLEAFFDYATTENDLTAAMLIKGYHVSFVGKGLGSARFDAYPKYEVPIKEHAC